MFILHQIRAQHEGLSATFAMEARITNETRPCFGGVEKEAREEEDGGRRAKFNKSLPPSSAF